VKGIDRGPDLQKFDRKIGLLLDLGAILIFDRELHIRLTTMSYAQLA
jgi:hypothetical protein